MWMRRFFRLVAHIFLRTLFTANSRTVGIKIPGVVGMGFNRF